MTAGEERTRLRRDLRLITADGVVFSIMVGVGETYLAAFALATGSSAVVAGLLATLPMVAGGVVQLTAPSVLDRFPSYRAFCVLGAALQAVAFLPLVIGALVGDAPPGLLFACAAIYWAAGLATAPGWNAWMARLIPVRIRGRYFGRRQAVAQVGVLGGLCSGGLVLHLTGRDPRVFAILFAAAFVCRALSIYCLSRQSIPAGRPRPEGMRIRHLLREAFGSRSREVIGTILVVHFAVHLASPFFTPFLLVETHVSYGVFTALLAANFAGKIASYPLLGRLARRTGLRQLMAVGAIGTAPLPLLWAALPVPWLLLLQALAGMCWAAFELGVLLSFLDVTNDRERTGLISTFHLLNTATMAGASLAGGAMLAWLGQDRDAYVALFAISSIGRLLGVVVLLGRARRGMAIEIPALRILAVRPWGEAIIRPVAATVGLARKLKRKQP